MTKHNETIDVIKGVLIILVIIGHWNLSTLFDNPWRYFIYTFHMPLFIFISGYLLNPSKLSMMSWKELFHKYWHRMFRAWIVAWIVYSTWRLGHYENITTRDVIMKCFIRPYNHLWYVPSLFAMICMAIVCTKRRISYWWLFGLGIVTIIAERVHSFPEICKLWPLIYFAFGLIIKQNGVPQRLINVKWGGVILALILNAVSYYLVNSSDITQQYYMAIIVPIELLFCLSVGNIIRSGVTIKSSFLQYIGRNSLQIYLWHMIPIIVLHHFL